MCVRVRSLSHIVSIAHIWYSFELLFRVDNCTKAETLHKAEKKIFVSQMASIINCWRAFVAAVTSITHGRARMCVCVRL